jgi:tetratricopeptide (TPR) repeat protein
MVFVWLLTLSAPAAADNASLKAAHRAARAADCGPALALVGIADAPESKHRDRAAAAQVSCAASTLQPPDPAGFYAEPPASSALVEPALRRELTTSVALATGPLVRSPTTPPAALQDARALLLQAREVDPENWMLWENSLYAALQLLDSAAIQVDAWQLLDAWSPQGPPGGARVLGLHCSQADPPDPLLGADRDEGARILAACHERLQAALAQAPDDRALVSGHLVVLEAAAFSTDPSLRASALAALVALAPDSTLVKLLQAGASLEAGDVSAAAARYAEVIEAAPDNLEARLRLGLLLGRLALARYDAEPAEDADTLAQQAAAHLEVAFAHPGARAPDQIEVARLMVQLCDRLADQAAEDRWRRAYSRLMGH